MFICELWRFQIVCPVRLSSSSSSSTVWVFLPAFTEQTGSLCQREPGPNRWRGTFKEGYKRPSQALLSPVCKLSWSQASHHLVFEGIWLEFLPEVKTCWSYPLIHGSICFHAQTSGASVAYQCSCHSKGLILALWLCFQRWHLLSSENWWVSLWTF